MVPSVTKGNDCATVAFAPQAFRFAGSTDSASPKSLPARPTPFASGVGRDPRKHPTEKADPKVGLPYLQVCMARWLAANRTNAAVAARAAVDADTGLLGLVGIDLRLHVGAAAAAARHAGAARSRRRRDRPATGDAAGGAAAHAA